MRWIYRDPQGQTQGPWSGLEMHDWYKAGFFSPELLVKKYEDPDYEPLAQLIRRIGNSREPFLVPQIGIPHGLPSNNGPTAWAGSGPPPSAGGAQPPFANSFPSFGTTLTAEQQNALERRKQEEQYLMARQKEHLAQQQMAQRMHIGMQPAGQGSHSGLLPSGQLHHHGSAQSLHSQPSFGSMTSPTAGPFQPSPIQAPQGHQPGFFDNSFRSPGQTGGLGAVGAGVDSLGHIREEEIPGIMDRLNQGNHAAPGQFGAPGQPVTGQQQMQPPPINEHELQIQQMLQDRARLQQEQALHDAQQQGAEADQFASEERYRQFQQLQGQGAAGGIDARFQPAMGNPAMSDEQSSAVESSLGSPAVGQREQTPPQELSLTEQVQKAASVQQSPVQPHPGLPQPFPPAPSQSPLPAPAAQRAGRQSVADQLQTDQRELSDSPSVETPSAVAPWAKEPAEAPKGPSLKEIQEMEARKAAEAEEVASAARRAAFQREMEAQAQAQAVIPPAPGLPATASWAAAGGSPATPTGTSSAWAKAAQKPSSTGPAKSMAQIQKEEEARKKKLAAAAATAQAAVIGSVPSPVGGKSYANLAGKVSSPATNPVGGAWTTVGAGGKPRTPSGPPAPTTTRTVSSGIVPTAQPTAKKLPTRSSTMASPGGVNAQEEFRKWAVGELRPDLNKGIPGKTKPTARRQFGLY
jgi:PERQ amino acid-rich with GYF domain-containing protein